MKKRRIVLVDDHTMFREGVKKIINDTDTCEVIAEIGDGIRLQKILKEHSPDLVLLDISLPGKGGIEVTADIKRDFPEIKVLILSMHKNTEYVIKAMNAGANGYLVKEGTGDELIGAIHSILGGRSYISPLLRDDFTEQIWNSRSQAEEKNDTVLSTREISVLKLVANGKTNKEIADVLYISVRTAEHHRYNIMKKLRLKNSAEMVKYALDKNFIET
ncbi:MAG: response regulator transcription factor [Deltaproteobacteria bacterium]|jgi:DNA-binding NarL/FixJ family response regulator|nr:response regulator transcription factor [Deltaproteobacteria bacterium]